MAIHLSKKELENIKNYKYETSGWTFCDKLFDPWWEFCVSKLSNVSILILTHLLPSENLSKLDNTHGNHSSNNKLHLSLHV